MATFAGQISSGVTAKATVTDAAIDVLASTPGTNKVYDVTILNEGSVAGFYSLDGGVTKSRLPAGPCAINLDLRRAPIDLSLKLYRVVSGSDVTGVFASALVFPT